MLAAVPPSRLPLALLLAVAVVLAAALPGCAANAPGHYAEVNGLRMYYEVHGSGPALVLLHGGGSTIQTSFGRVLPELARTHRVIAVELQGLGHTPDRDAPFSFEQDADDVAELLRQLGVAQADFYGYSNGATTAMQAALRHPQLVRRLVLAAALFHPADLAPELKAIFAKPGNPEEMPPSLRAAYLAVAPDPSHLPVMVEKSITRMREFRDWTPEMLARLDMPVLLVFGDRDIVSPEVAGRMLGELKYARLLVVPGTDHVALVDRAEVLLSVIPTFLAEADRR